MNVVTQVQGIGGYRDVILNVVMNNGGIKIIGEIQVQYEKLYDLKQQVCLSVHDQNDSSFSAGCVYARVWKERGRAVCVCIDIVK